MAHPIFGHKCFIDTLLTVLSYKRIKDVIFFYVLNGSHGWEKARWIIMGPIISSHQVEEYVLSAVVLGEDYLFLNWIYRAGWFVPIKDSIKANQVLPSRPCE